MREHPTEDDIVKALSKSGYLLEQQVANKLEALSHYVWTNEAFQDVDEGKSREIDAKARKQFFHSDELNISGWTEIIAECKNMSSPLVFIGRDKSDVDHGKTPSEIVFPSSEYHKPLKRDHKNKVTSYTVVPACPLSLPLKTGPSFT